MREGVAGRNVPLQVGAEDGIAGRSREETSSHSNFFPGVQRRKGECPGSFASADPTHQSLRRTDGRVCNLRNDEGQSR